MGISNYKWGCITFFH
ncbi:hypothetical protein, partial [Plasmodium yoelii yoelii]